MAKASRSNRNSRRGNNSIPSAPSSSSAQRYGRAELIVVARPDAGLRATRGGVAAASEASANELRDVLSSAGARLQPLFGATEERVRNQVASMRLEAAGPELATFYHVEAPPQDLEALAENLRNLDSVEAAYVKPAGEPPQLDDINRMLPAEAEPPATTPNFESRQGYLNAAPAGIDARYAWRFPGGRGAGLQIIDCEWGWRFTHEDLLQAQGGVVIGVPSPLDDHGTAVLGVVSGDRNAFGVIGICAHAVVSGASFQTLPTASVIRQAADRLRPGDILLLEIHRPGPDASGVGQDGFIAIEWWPDDLAAIQYAVARGVIVVEAAGNGARNLDAAIYNQRPSGFPATWQNPFNPNNPSSGAVLVGAGAPPPGTHGNDHGPDRSRLGFSNYGRRVDAQGWGREVTSTGYGDLQGGANRDLWYTDSFSGTSSASPIVVGALGCIQGILRARFRPLLTSRDAIRLLRSTGSPQQDRPGAPSSQRIGNRPDLRQMIASLFGISPDSEGEMNEVNAAGNGHRRVVINVHSEDVTVNIRGVGQNGAFESTNETDKNGSAMETALVSRG